MSALGLIQKLMIMSPIATRWVGSSGVRLFKFLVLGMFLQQVKCYDESCLYAQNLSLSESADTMLGL